MFFEIVMPLDPDTMDVSWTNVEIGYEKKIVLNLMLVNMETKNMLCVLIDFLFVL